MSFQASNFKGKCFLNLLDDELNTIEPSYIKEGPWIKHFRYSNLLRATRAITNHALIGEYHLRFFSKEDFSCPCGLYPIETRHDVLYDCRRFDSYWNPMRDTISQFVSFLKYNPNAFSFREGIT